MENTAIIRYTIKSTDEPFKRIGFGLYKVQNDYILCIGIVDLGDKKNDAAITIRIPEVVGLQTFLKSCWKRYME